MTPTNVLVEFSDFLNEPPQYEEQFRVREYRHETYPKWLKVVAYINALQAENAALQKDAERFQTILLDPVGARHLLHLLQLGKGNETDFRNMLDRIKVSRDAALRAKG